MLGELVISLQQTGDATSIYAAARSKGQWIDWGKSRGVLKTLFGDLEKKAAA
jgi:hypothetical protein